MTLLKLSDNVYPPIAKDAALATLGAGITDPEAVQYVAEVRLAAYLNVPPEWVMLTNSATSALHLAYQFMLMGRRPQVPVYTWPASYTAAGRYTLVDADPWPYFQDEENPFTVGVCMWGQPWRFGHVDLLDAAHAFGEGIDQLRSDEVSAVVYSFGPRKEIPCMRGGALISKRIDNRWRAYRDSGTIGPHAVFHKGLNLEMSELSAAILGESLPFHEGQKLRRQTMMQRYFVNLRDVPSVRVLTSGGSGHLEVLHFESEIQRDAVAWALKKNDIQSGIHYRLPMWLAPTKFPRAYDLSTKVLSVPLHLNMDEKDVDRVCQIIAASA